MFGILTSYWIISMCAFAQSSCAKSVHSLFVRIQGTTGRWALLVRFGLVSFDRIKVWCLFFRAHRCWNLPVAHFRRDLYRTVHVCVSLWFSFTISLGTTESPHGKNLTWRFIYVHGLYATYRLLIYGRPIGPPHGSEFLVVGDMLKLVDHDVVNLRWTPWRSTRLSILAMTGPPRAAAARGRDGWWSVWLSSSLRPSSSLACNI